MEFDVPQPHTLAAWIMTSGGTYVTMLGVLGPRAVTTWAKDLDHPTPMPVAEQPADEVLAEIAGALRRTDMTWPRNDEHDFVRWRALAWSRCREHLPEFPEWEPLTDDERAQLIDDFIAAGAPDNDVTRSVADLFLDYGDGYIESGTCTGARPRFALTRRALEPQWIEPVVAAVDEHVAEFTNAFDDESAWGPAKEVVAELQARGVDPADREAMEDGLRALNAERLARRLLEE